MEDQPADLCVVNTCTVTMEGDAKSRQAIRRLARENPDARIVVMGCYATRAPGEVASLPGVAEVVTDKRELPDLLGRFGVVDVPTGISGLVNRRRAYVKVQDGCLLRCSYCIIPHVRPTMSSRPPEHILDEVRRLVDAMASHGDKVCPHLHVCLQSGSDAVLRRMKLIESPSKTRCDHVFGTSCRYAPVELAGNIRLRGEMIDVVPTRYEDGRLLAP